MSAPTPILICGDAGPGRHALLARRDIEALWTDTVQGALATLRHAEPKICLIRPREIKGDAKMLVRQCRDNGGPPCVVVLDHGEWAGEGEWLAAGATEVVEIERSEALMQLIGEYTGLAFAKEQRATLETVVEVLVDGEKLVLETTNISASGAGIRGLPPVRLGTLVRLGFVVHAHPIGLWARVVRTWKQDGKTMGGVRFAGMTEAQQAALRDFVRQQNALMPQAYVDFGNLFEDISVDEACEALRSEDLLETMGGVDDGKSSDPDVAALQAYLTAPDVATKDAIDLPSWLLRVAAQMSLVETDAVCADEAPPWAGTALTARVSLARWRASNTEGPLPSWLAERAYDLFMSLAEATKGESDEVVTQVGAIRASLLRELLSKPQASRANVIPGTRLQAVNKVA